RRPLAQGDNLLNFLVPRSSLAGPTYARFRVSTGGGLSPTGEAADGEVEDYRVQIDFHNTSPDARDDAYAVDEDTPRTVAAAEGVLANDTDMDGSTLTALLLGRPDHGTLTLNRDGSFTYRPAADFHGADSFTYVASDGTDVSNVATVT